MQSTAVLLVVGLNRSLLGEHAPNLQAAIRKGNLHTLRPVLPAVTCSVQASMLTGLSPAEHGIVGNGWYNREPAEVQFWKQSNHLTRGEKVWEAARRKDPDFTMLNMFWWYNMYSSADYSVTPRPIYKADGRKIPDCYSEPPDLRDELQRLLGKFPLFHFWGPAADIRSSQWIADATRIAHGKFNPTLTLAYLPHLDYALQKLGPDHPDIPRHVRQIDQVVGELLEYFDRQGVATAIVSEYGIEPVTEAIPINRFLREESWIRLREEEGLELLDAGASEAFAVVDHQIAHVYVKNSERVAAVAERCRAIPGVANVYAADERDAVGLNHPRAGDIVLVADRQRWFSYYYWLDDARAPDFARTVDIHRKPGYDPCELLIDPALRFPKLQIARRLLKKKLGFRTLMDVIPLDANLVKGSHGRVDQDEALRPVVILPEDGRDRPETMDCRDLHEMLLQIIFTAESSAP